MTDTLKEEDFKPDILQPIGLDNEMKKWLVNYVGEKLQPEDDEVNVEMVIQVMAKEFPEFLLPVAEENFIRGYKQGLNDAEIAQKEWQENLQKQLDERGITLQINNENRLY
jgi:hypothetical protein